MAVFNSSRRPVYWEPHPDYFESKTKVEVLKKTDNDNEDKEKKRGRLYTFITYFAETTSFMGIPKIWASPRIPLKVMWALFFIAATVIMIIQLVELFNNFNSFPIKTSVKLGFSPLPFPTVTVCNMNPIRLSRARELSCEMQKALELEPQYQSEECVDYNGTLDYEGYTETELYCNEEGECLEEEIGGLDKFYIRRERIADLLASESVDVRSYVGHDIESMLMECTLNGRSCSSDNFTRFLSKDLGNCYTFDSKGVRAKKSGPESGLSMVFNLESEEFIRTFKTGYGLRVVVHQRGTRPFPGHEGFTVSAGSETSITMKMVEISRIGDPHGTCNDSQPFKKKFGIEYTERACRELCERNLVIDKCKCQSDNEEAVANTIKICGTEAEWACEERTISKHIVDTGKGIDVCKCGTPCKEMVYQTSLSSRAWPVLSHVAELEQQVCTNFPGNVKCSYSAYDFGNSDLRTYSFLKLKLYFESLNYESVTEQPFYDTERFLSDIGGTMGLWIGASVLSLVEVIEIIAELFCLCFCRKPKQQKK